jgi:pSer/pThr/pTyr-binding forkhead associated (FHA) protein
MHICPKGHQSQAGDYCDECGAPIGGSRSTSSAGMPTSAPVATPDAVTPPGLPCPECATPQGGRFCEVCGFDFLMVKLGGAGTPGATGTPGAPVAAEETAVPSAAATPDATASPGVTPSPAAEAVTAPDQVGGAPDGVPPSGLPKRTATAADRPNGWALAVTSDADYHARMQAMAEPDATPIAFPAFVPPRRFALRGAQALIGRPSRSRGIEPEIDLSGPPADPAVSHAHAMLLAQPDGFWAVVDLESANGTYVNDEPEAIEPNVPRLLDSGDRIFVGAWTVITLTRT